MLGLTLTPQVLAIVLLSLGVTTLLALAIMSWMERNA